MEKVLPEVPGIGGMLLRAYTRIAGSPAHLQAKLLRRLRATSAPTIRQGFRRLPAQQLRDLMALDPAAIYAKVRAPALLVSGAKDLQCNPADAERIAAILGPTAEAVQVPDLTHILRKDPGRHTFLSYARLLKQPMDPEVVSRVGVWLERLRG
ncbi:MAG: alpha/beta hydrolase [Bauldia sp.]|nr:alpha/beta hydrolase [Bauldia sp.]